MGSARGGRLALRAGHTLAENISNLTRDFPVNERGYFGIRGKGARASTRIIESGNPARTASKFAHLAASNPTATRMIDGKGIVWKMRDGGVVSYRYYSSSPDRSPVVELSLVKVPGVRDQKIHFVKKAGRQR